MGVAGVCDPVPSPYLLPLGPLGLHQTSTEVYIISYFFSGRQFKITLMASIVDRYIFPSDSSVVCQIMDMRQGWLRYRNR